MSPLDNVSLYRDCDVCVQPSHFEGLGLDRPDVSLEVQAADRPRRLAGAFLQPATLLRRVQRYLGLYK